MREEREREREREQKRNILVSLLVSLQKKFVFRSMVCALNNVMQKETRSSSRSINNLKWSFLKCYANAVLSILFPMLFTMNTLYLFDTCIINNQMVWYMSYQINLKRFIAIIAKCLQCIRFILIRIVH